jgi:hypothetical protein
VLARVPKVSIPTSVIDVMVDMLMHIREFANLLILSLSI